MKDPRIERAGVEGFNKPKRTPNHPTKSHVVVAKSGDQIKTIRFGQQGVSGSPKREGESDADKARRASFKARHSENIAKGKMSAAFWADKVKWWNMQGLYANINAKKKRIKEGSGETMRQVGAKGAPTAKAFKESAKTAKKPKKGNR
jgi:hypothetical protein